MKSAGLRTLASRLRRAGRLNPLLLCALILLGLVFLIGADKNLSGRASALVKAKESFLTALTETRTQLAGLLAVVAKDQRIPKAIDWKLAHSTEQTLKAFLQRGAMDHLAIFQSDCKLVAKASLGDGISPSCPESGREKSGIRWSHEDGAPVLTMHRPLDGSLIAVGRVHLQRDWLSLYPELKQYITELDLIIAPQVEQNQVAIIREGLQKGGEHAAILISPRTADRLALGWGEENLNVLPLMQYMIVVCLVLLGVTSWRMREKDRRQKQELSRFNDWCRGLSPPGLHATQESEAASLPKAQKFVSMALQTKIDMIRQLSARRDQLEATLRSRERESQQLQRRLADLAELDSLAGQLQNSIGAFIHRLHQLHQKTRSLEDLLQTGVSDVSQGLYTTWEQWRVGIQDKGARKFLRGMSETPGSDGTKSLLDEQLDHIQEEVVALHDHAISGSMLADEIVEAAALAGQIASHWHSLATIDHELELPETLDCAIEQAAELVRLTHKFSLDLQIAPTPLPPVPEKIWVAALHHLLLAQIELWDIGREERELTITAKTKTHGDHGWLILAFNEQPLFTPSKSETNHHLEVAKAILGPFSLDLTLLPVRESLPPLALRWSLKMVQVPGKPTLNKTTHELTTSQQSPVLLGPGDREDHL